MIGPNGGLASAGRLARSSDEGDPGASQWRSDSAGALNFSTITGVPGAPGTSWTGRRSDSELTVIENWPLEVRTYGESWLSSSSLGTWPAAKCQAPGCSWNTWRPSG